ncbi:hypothetical protein NBH00_06755 [Paraconexibacter antarcticus]|uniref:Uncharacterized protein n=1 Tax=Paraconexibacter antarcticus TaxID=2949664 RepID=A0ABY5DW67_9ACTN|nr:hypothetical protein [Paraconexibacter antarcticus]UTI65906.1 hypothetical protein NBH00_06755 [Paraconexibacter antarcticus]
MFRGTGCSRAARTVASTVLAGVVVGVGAGAPAAAAATLRAPAAQTPAPDAQVQTPPVFSWGAVPRAAQYEFQLAADDQFSSIVLGSGFGKGDFRTHSTAATLDTAIPDGTYYWRVRAISASDKVGRWSSTRTLVKAWSTAPVLGLSDGIGVAWPSTPLLLKWSAVPYAAKYSVTITTDPALSSGAIGSSPKVTDTQATVFALPGTLAPGTYYWAITPLDARGHPGTRSHIGTFAWSWPTTSPTRVTDLDPDPTVFDPQFSWDPIPGAAKYEVEVNSASNFPAGSKWCCTDPTIGTSLSPTKPLANNRYYWRVRAVDSSGNAGQWNNGPDFNKDYDSGEPTIPNLAVRSTTGAAVPGSGGPPATDTPIVSWDPVPGAASYEVQITPYQSGFGCDWALVGHDSRTRDTQTAAPAWTPLGPGGHFGPTSYPSPQAESALPAGGAKYCLRVLARTDDDAKGGAVISQWTQLGGTNQPAFQYNDPPAYVPLPSGQVLQATDGDYIAPGAGAAVTRTPLFTWKPIPSARGYYVIVARDDHFTKIADVGFTNVPAYAPRKTSAGGIPLSDETTSYYWSVIPTTGASGTGSNAPGPTPNHPFNKNSAPPGPAGPAAGADILTQPTFAWTRAEGALHYQLQVAQDPTFANPINDVQTDSTAYTSSSTYPADTVLYWRVRANDVTSQGLNWSPVQTFRRRLPTPVPSPLTATTGEDIRALSWSAVEAAVSYSVHVDQVDGSSKDFTLNSTSFTPIDWYGQGIWHWKVRANFAALGTTVPGPYSATQNIIHTLGPPSGASGRRTPGRILLSWSPDPSAKQYQAQLSTTDGFGSAFASVTTDNTAWAPDLTSDALKKGGTIYWQVLAIDSGGNKGKGAKGSFRLPVALTVVPTGILQRGRTSTLTLRVTSPSGSPIRLARVAVSGLGVRAAHRVTNRAGKATFRVHPRRRGNLIVVVTRAGHQTTRVKVPVA